MVSRLTIYKEFLKYVAENIKILNNKLYYYNGRLDISNNKLNIFIDSIKRHTNEIYLIYNIKNAEIDGNFNSIVYTNGNVINNDSPKLKDIIKQLIKIDAGYNKHTIIFIKDIIDNYFEIKKEIRDINRQIQLITDKLDFFNKYKDLSKKAIYYIISKCNGYYEKALLDGETIALGHHIGNLKVVPKNVSGKKNWKASFEYKEQLIKEGKIPFNKKDSLLAKHNNVPYHGVYWFVYYDNEVQHYINWYAHSFKLPNKDNYSFYPARYNHSDKTISEIRKEVKKVEDVDKYKIGIVNKLSIALDVNELQFLKYVRNDI
jgi:hypothetical protein